MKKVMGLLVGLLLVSAPAFAGKIKSNKFRTWCEVNGEVVSISPTQPPPQTWKTLCIKAGGKVKGGLRAVTAVAIKTVAGSKGKVLKRNRAMLNKLNGQIKALQRRLQVLKKLRKRLKKQTASLVRLPTLSKRRKARR